MTGGTIELGAAPVVRADPRVRRTHLALHEAMVALCLADGYRAVTVDQLVERAGVTRATFYTHFRDKEHLLLAIAEQVVRDVLERFGQAGTDRLLMLSAAAGIATRISRPAQHSPAQRADTWCACVCGGTCVRVCVRRM